MKQTKEQKSCVFKRDWKHYKTCYECGILRQCERSDKPKWYERILEHILVSWERWRINRKLRTKFRGMSKKNLRRVISAIKKSNKQKED